MFLGAPKSTSEQSEEDKFFLVFKMCSSDDLELQRNFFIVKFVSLTDLILKCSALLYSRVLSGEHH